MKFRPVKAISLLLIALIVISAFNVTALDLNNSAFAQNDITNMQSTNVANQNATSSEPVVSLPDILLNDPTINSEEITRTSAVENNLYTIAYTNSEGVCTLKLYSHPVKYIDQDGQTKDISLDIEPASNGSFRTSSSNIITEFPKKITDGISLSYDGIKINLTPMESANNNISTGEIGSESATLSADSKTVSYAFGNKTHLEYELTYTGFKEDIVVESYTGQTEYNFILETNGLTLVNYDGSYYLEDSEGNIKATIGDIIIFTADEANNAFGTMTHTVVKANQIYALTIHLDEDYLSNEKTIYPIRIDPTIEIYYDNNGAGAIEDITINEVDTFRATSGSIMVGRHPEDSTLSRGLMRFPGLSLPTGLKGSQISSAYVEIRDVMAESTSPVLIDCHIYKKSAPSWSEAAGANWTSVGTDYVGTKLQGWTVNRPNGMSTGSGDNNWYRYNITSLAAKWADGTEDPNKGIVFKASDAFEAQTGSAVQNYVRTFASYNRASYKPTLTIIYNDFEDGSISISASVIEVKEGETKTLSATVSPSYLSVSWSSSDSSIASVSSTGTVTGNKAGKVTITATITDDYGTTHRAYCTVYVYISNGIYYIQNRASGNYLHVEDGKINDLANVHQYSKYPDSQALKDKLHQMWKICYLGYGLYSIRPVHELTMGLHVTYDEGYDENNVDIFTIGTDDTLDDVTSYATWCIEWSLTGYMFYVQSMSESNVLQIDPLSLSVGDNVIVDDYSSTASYCKWNLIRYSSTFQGIILYDLDTQKGVTTSTEYVAPGETRSLSTLGLYAVVYSSSSINQSINWSSSNTSVATVNATTGAITGISPGVVTITGTRSFFLATVTVTIQVVITEVENGTYHLRNAARSTYVDIKEQVMSNGTVIHLWTKHIGDTQKWIIQHVEDGYYTIKSYHSNNNDSTFYLGVKDDSSSESAEIVLRSGNITSGMMWKFVLTDEGNYKIVSKLDESKVLDAPTTKLFQTEFPLFQNTYTDDESYTDEWAFFYNLNIKISVDNAYVSRHANYVSLIDEYMEDVNDYYRREFGINITYSLTKDPVTSWADKCGNAYYEVCEHKVAGICNQSTSPEVFSPDVNIHHKNIANIMHHETAPNIHENVTMLFTGHDICYVFSDGHSFGGVEGIANSKYGMMVIASNGNVKDIVVSVIMHEIGHLYGAEDHYGGHQPTTDQKKAETGRSDYSEQCCYGELRTTEMCVPCKEIIMSSSHIYNH